MLKAHAGKNTMYTVGINMKLGIPNLDPNITYNNNNSPPSPGNLLGDGDSASYEEFPAVARTLVPPPENNTNIRHSKAQFFWEVGVSNTVVFTPSFS